MGTLSVIAFASLGKERFKSNDSFLKSDTKTLDGKQ
jgi:hypothetical protein